MVRGKVIGITGNSGSGKSSVAAVMARKHGAYIIDADEIAHSVLLKGGAAYADTVEAFGEGILAADGEVDRARLGRIVFADECARMRLMEITHKHIGEEMLRQLERARAVYPYVVMDAPLLIEAGLQAYADAVWLVNARREERLGRIVARDGLTEAEAEARFSRQTAFEELKVYADVVIDNSGGLTELESEVSRALGLMG